MGGNKMSYKAMISRANQLGNASKSLKIKRDQDLNMKQIYTEPLSDNTFYTDWQNAKAFVKSKKDYYGLFSFPINGINVGDIIHASCKVKRISGDMPRIAFDQFGDDDVKLGFQDVSCKDSYEVTKATFIAQESSHWGRITFGSWLVHDSEFEIMDMYVEVIQQDSFNPLRACMIRKNDDKWEFDTRFTNDSGEVSINSNRKTMVVSFDRHIVSRGRSLAFANISYYGDGKGYIARTGLTTKYTTTIEITNLSGETINLDTLPNGIFIDVLLVNTN